MSNRVNRRPIQLKLSILSNSYYYKIPLDFFLFTARGMGSNLHQPQEMDHISVTPFPLSLPALPFSVFHEPSPLPTHLPTHKGPQGSGKILISRMYK